MPPPKEVPKARQQHPSDETLSGLAKNSLAPDDTVVVQQHVSRCKRCQSVIDEFRMEDSPENSVATKPTKKPEPEPARAQSEKVASKKAERKPEKQTVSIPAELRNHAQYKVLSLIGRGGMGNVFLVEHKLTARKEVLKVIHSHLLSREDVRSRFKREIQSAAKLNHPNVVQTLTAIEEGSMIGLVMEYVKGESLSSQVNRVGPLPVDRARDFVKQIAMGLDHAHQQNMVHRDIKPQNVLASKQGDDFRVKILDFGLAKTTGFAASSSDLTIDGAIIGTPNYMAPEQAINPSLADIRSDIYSLGCTWFFMLTGRSPFESDSPLAIMNAHQNSSPPSVHSLRLGVPEETERILSKMLAKRPDQRFQNPAELIAALSSTKLIPMVETVPLASHSEAFPLQFAFDISSPKRPKKKSVGKFAKVIHVAMIALPSVALAGVLIYRPHWITNLGSALRQIDATKSDSTSPGQASIVLAKIPADVQVFIDGFPAKFERPRADAQPSISASPGTYQLSARRNDREIYKITVKLVANETLEMDLGTALEKTRPRPVAPSEVKTVEGSKDVPMEDGKPAVAPIDSFSSEASKTSVNPPILGEEVVMGKRFVIQQRLDGHSSLVFRVAFLSDGRLISAERNGKPIQQPNKPKSSSLQSMSQINQWWKDGTYQSLVNEGTLDDFSAAYNGKAICHIGRVFGANFTVQLYKEGRSFWKSDITTVGRPKSDLPYFVFSVDSDEFLMVSSQGSFNRLNLRTGKIQPPVSSLISIDKLTVESLSATQKLDHALFGLRSGEFLVIRTRDGKQVSNETLVTPDSAKTVAAPVVATQFNSKDSRIATLHSEGSIRLFEFPSLNHLEDLPQTLQGSINVFGRSTNGRFLAAIGDRMRLSVYDLDEGTVFASWELPKGDAATSVSIDNLGKRIAIGFESGSVVLFQPAKE